MTEQPENDRLDKLDRLILGELQANGRISNAELANRIKLSPPATHTRLKRLEQRGYIRQYAALLDRERIGYDMLCFVHISLQLHQPEQVESIRVAINQMPEVIECYHVTGESDYLLKVVVRNRKDLERFIVQQLTPIQGIARIYTSLVLNEVKATTMLPLE
jgi:Lrp/AsnC family leucine-responsive transcriptional regulator